MQALDEEGETIGKRGIPIDRKSFSEGRGDTLRYTTDGEASWLGALERGAPDACGTGLVTNGVWFDHDVLVR